MKPSEIKKQLKSEIVWGKPSKESGGQTVAKVQPDVSLTCDSLGLQITISTNRSQLKNKEMCMKIFDLVSNAFIKGEL